MSGRKTCTRFAARPRSHRGSGGRARCEQDPRRSLLFGEIEFWRAPGEVQGFSVRTLEQGESRLFRPFTCDEWSTALQTLKAIQNSRSLEPWRVHSRTREAADGKHSKAEPSSPDRSCHYDEARADGSCLTRRLRKLSGRASISPETLLSSSRGAFWTLRRMFDPQLSAFILPSSRRSCDFSAGSSTIDGLHPWSKHLA